MIIEYLIILLSMGNLHMNCICHSQKFHTNKGSEYNDFHMAAKIKIIVSIWTESVTNSIY